MDDEIPPKDNVVPLFKPNPGIGRGLTNPEVYFVTNDTLLTVSQMLHEFQKLSPKSRLLLGSTDASAIIRRLEMRLVPKLPEPSNVGPTEKD